MQRLRNLQIGDDTGKMQVPAIILYPLRCHPERSEGSAVALGTTKWCYFRIGDDTTRMQNLYLSGQVR